MFRAAVFPRGIPVISRRTIYLIAFVTAACVLTRLVRSPADAAARTLVDILTRSTVDAESVSVGTLARVASERVLANAHAEIVIFELRAFVDIGARSIVIVQSESGIAGANVTAPRVQTLVLAEPCRLTLVYIVTGACRASDILKALVAQTFVRSSGIFAAAVRSTNRERTRVHATLVDVDAIIVEPDREASRANAVIPALPVLANLVLAALVRALLTLVYVDAVLTGWVQGVTGSTNHSGHASVRSHGVDAFLREPARIRRSLALIYVHAFAAGSGFEAVSAVCPRISWSQRRRGHRGSHCDWRRARLRSR